MTEWIYEKQDTLLKPIEELIRCKACKYYQSDGGAIMECTISNNNLIWSEDDYCSYGEQRED